MRAETAEAGRARVLVWGLSTAAARTARALTDAYEVVPFPGGPGPWRGALEGGAPDLVALPVSPPGHEAVAMLEAVQRDAQLAGVPVVCLFEGALGDELQIRLFDAGAVDVIDAGASAAVVKARLDRAIRLGRERRVLAEQAQTDALTGLANFRALSDRLREEFKRALRYRYPLAVAVIDVDRLKQVNDQLGHDAGNRVIAAVGRHLKSNLREVDFAARFGGDEFVVLLPHQTVEEAAIFGERVRRGLAQVPEATSLGEGAPPLSLSVGIAGLAPDAPRSGPEALMDAADEALYAAKRGGRDRVELWEHPAGGAHHRH